MRNLLVVTGATGFVGTHAVEFALKQKKDDFIFSPEVSIASDHYENGRDLRH